jgi:hypothetical protein
MAGEVDFDTLRQEALTTTLPTAAQDSAAAFGLHTGAETKLLFARALAGLIGAFHKNLAKSGIGEDAEFSGNVNNSIHFASRSIEKFVAQTQ